MNEGREKIVHVLVEGRARCGLGGVPGEWPEGHVWVGEAERRKATCPGCKDPPFTFRGEPLETDEQIGRALGVAVYRCNEKPRDEVRVLEMQLLAGMASARLMVRR